MTIDEVIARSGYDYEDFGPSFQSKWQPADDKGFVHSNKRQRKEPSAGSDNGRHEASTLYTRRDCHCQTQEEVNSVSHFRQESQEATSEQEYSTMATGQLAWGYHCYAQGKER